MVEIVVAGDNGTQAIIQTAAPIDIRVDGALRGPGIAPGGRNRQLLVKSSDESYETMWGPALFVQATPPTDEESEENDLWVNTS